MKKTLITILLCTMIAGCAPVPAATLTPDATSTAQPTAAPTEAGSELKVIQTAQADMDGDGTAETITASFNTGETSPYLAVVDIKGSVNMTVTRQAEYPGKAYLCNCDGKNIVLFDYDYASDDYVTVAVYAENGELKALDCAQGTVNGVKDGILSVMERVDILGTWQTIKTYKIAENFVYTGQPLVIIEGTLITAADIPAEIDGGIVPANSTVVLTATDGSTYMDFTLNGTKGRFAITPTEDFGWQIDGRDETELFTEINYWD